MAEDDFLAKDDEAQEEEQQQEEKVSIGEKEYSQDDLKDLVGLAEEVKGFEEKQGQAWGEVVRSWGKRGERIGELKEKVKEYEERIGKETAEKVQKGEPLKPEEQERVVKDELERYGVITKENFKDMYETLREGERLLEKTRRVIRTNKKKGYPAVTEEKLLEFMSDPRNPRDPSNAYKLMFEGDIAKIKEEQLQGMKKTGMITEERSTAGQTKEPEPRKITDENIDEALHEVINRGV